MTDKINELGPMNVSKHCSNPDEMNVIDIPLRYIDDYNKADDFVQILNSYKQSGWFDRLIYPGNNPNENVYHLQINVVE